MLKKSQVIGILKLTVGLALIYILLKIYLLPFILSPQVQSFVESIGPLGYLIIICYTVISHVFAPVTGSPAVFLAATLYGINTGMLLLYTASLISATINFWISRKYGRNMIIKFVGQKSMKEIDEFILVEGKEVLIACRLFGFSIFDFLSYAAGLTKMPFKTYFIITACVSLIPTVTIALIFRNLDFRSESGMTIWLGSIVVAAIVFGILIKKYLRRIKNKEVGEG